ncbi:MAG: hypothetical protein H3C34_01890 [Caldilineaceae bacterium]|nr:hypothetical protein [Caldilineaceae bacterium]
MARTDRQRLWLRWVAANALGELVGLGATFAVIPPAFLWLEGQPGGVTAFILFIVAVASGAIEATIVGLAQWWAMHPWFPTIARRTWWLATLAGALLAYILGYLPSTLMNMGEQATNTAVSEPPQAVVLLLAAGLGAVAGAVLSFAQWLAMRRTIARAGWWIPANMLAWLAGMPVIFWGIDAAQQGQPIIQSILLFATSLLLAGAVVGAIHGLFLVMLASENRAATA